MSEEVTNTDSSVEEDKNWKAVREENKALKEELVKYQTQERDTLYEGDLEVDALKAFLSEEFGEGVVSGQQDSIRNTVNEGQNRLDALQQQAQTINAAPNVQEQIAQAQQSGRVRDSIASKMMALDELKDK